MSHSLRKERILSSIIGLLILFQSLVSSASSKNPGKSSGLYLSFEEKWIVAQMLEAPRSEDPKSSFFSALDRVIELTKAQPKYVTVKTFNEFIELYRGYWPNTGNLKDDLAIIAKNPPKSLRKFVAANKDVQAQIDRFTRSRPEKMIQLLNLDSKQSQFFEKLFQSEFVPVDLRAQAWTGFQKLLKAEFEKTAEKISALTTSNDGQIDKTGIFIKKAMRLYLESLPDHRKEYIFLQFLSDNLKMTDYERMELLIQNSGPHLQKLLQIIADSVGPEMAEIFKKLESSVKEVSPVLASEIVKSEQENYRIIRWDPKPIGVGTMAQVHRGTMLGENNEEVGIVVRFLKPGIVERVIEDKAVMAKVAYIMDHDFEIRDLGLPLLSPLVDDIAKSVMVELDLPGTKDRQRMAAKDYDSSFLASFPEMKMEMKVAVPRIIDPIHGNSQVIVQQLVTGRKMESELAPYEEVLPDSQRQIVEKIAELWTESVLFKSGFYHADLHPGNILVSVREPETMVFILDYGMGGKITPSLQRAIHMVGLGSVFKRPNILADGLWKLSDDNLNRISRGRFFNLVHEKMRKTMREENMETWVTWALDQGLRLKTEVVNVHRGFLTVSKMLTKAQSPITTLNIAEALAKKYPMKVFELATSMGIPFSELGKLGWLALTKNQKEEVPLNASKKVTRTCESMFNN